MIDFILYEGGAGIILLIVLLIAGLIYQHYMDKKSPWQL